VLGVSFVLGHMGCVNVYPYWVVCVGRPNPILHICTHALSINLSNPFLVPIVSIVC
jgi:hypothetical protein